VYLGFDVIEYASKPADVDTWTTPVRVSRDSFPYRGSVVAVGPGHKPYVVWLSDAEAGHLYFSHREGDTWTIPRRLLAWQGVGSYLRGCADKFGRIHIVWPDDGLGHIWYARYEDTTWTGPDSIVSDTWPGIGNPDIATDLQGYAHVVFASDTHDSVGYVRQTPGGWLAPTYLPNPSFYAPAEPRITLDTAMRPQVVWYARWTYFNCWTGDSWSQAENIDSTSGGMVSVCTDSWNRQHAVMYDDIGTLERTRDRGRWSGALLVDTSGGAGDLLASRDRLHFLWDKRYPNYRDLWYSWRQLTPPAIEEWKEDSRGAIRAYPNPVGSGTRLVFELPRTGRVEMVVFDATGRVLMHRDLGILKAGRHQWSPQPCLPGGGIFFCRVRACGTETVVKLANPD
jgi:hypothetical protein